MEFTLDIAITARIQEVHDFDCQLVKQEKSFLVTTAQIQGGPQDVVSSVVLENEKKILQSFKEMKNRLSQHAPQLLEVFKIGRNSLTPIVDNFLSERRAGSYDMPL